MIKKKSVYFKIFLINLDYFLEYLEIFKILLNSHLNISVSSLYSIEFST